MLNLRSTLSRPGHSLRSPDSTDDPSGIDRIGVVPGLNAASVRITDRVRTSDTPVVVIHGVSRISDGCDRSGLSKRLDGIDHVTALLEHQPERHRRTSVDSHVAVDQQSRIVIVHGAIERVQYLVEPSVGLAAAGVMGACRDVPDLWSTTRNQRRVAPLIAYVDDVGHSTLD